MDRSDQTDGNDSPSTQNPAQSLPFAVAKRRVLERMNEEKGRERTAEVLRDMIEQDRV